MSTQEEDLPEELRPVVHRGEDAALETFVPSPNAGPLPGREDGVTTTAMFHPPTTPAGKEALPQEQAAAIQFHKLSPEQENAVKTIRAMGAQIKVELSILRSDANVGADPRWLAIAETDFQKALMAAVRAVVKPDFF